MRILIFKLSAFIFTGLFFITGCSNNKSSKNSTADSVKNSSTSTSGGKSLTPTIGGPTAPGQNIVKNESKISAGQGIVGRWTINDSKGDIVLEFTSSGIYIWTKDGKEVSRGTYSYDEKQNLMNMSGRGSTEINVDGNKMTEKVDKDITLTYKRL